MREFILVSGAVIYTIFVPLTVGMSYQLSSHLHKAEVFSRFQTYLVSQDSIISLGIDFNLVVCYFLYLV
jgi:hypothetical protein